MYILTTAAGIGMGSYGVRASAMAWARSSIVRTTYVGGVIQVRNVPSPGGARISGDQIKHLDRLFRHRALAAELHGREPLTAGREVIAEVLRELAAQPKVVRVSMQTSGVQLDAAWLDLFDELCPGLQIGISLDGDAQGNAWRIGYDGEPVYPRVATALELLAERGRKVGVRGRAHHPHSWSRRESAHPPRSQLRGRAAFPPRAGRRPSRSRSSRPRTPPGRRGRRGRRCRRPGRTGGRRR